MRFRWTATLLVLLVVIDQIIKGLVSIKIPLQTSIPLIPHILSIANIHNDGAAWSILANQQMFFKILTAIVIVVLFYYLFKFRKSSGKTFTIILLLAGAIGNLIDRLMQGYVVDMFQLDFISFPIFNFADACLTIGVLCLFIVILREK